MKYSKDELCLIGLNCAYDYHRPLLPSKSDAGLMLRTSEAFAQNDIPVAPEVEE